MLVDAIATNINNLFLGISRPPFAGCVFISAPLPAPLLPLPSVGERSRTLIVHKVHPAQRRCVLKRVSLRTHELFVHATMATELTKLLNHLSASAADNPAPLVAMANVFVDSLLASRRALGRAHLHRSNAVESSSRSWEKRVLRARCSRARASRSASTPIFCYIRSAWWRDSFEPRRATHGAALAIEAR